MTKINVNGKIHTVDADPNTPLLWVIREQLGMTGTKYGCGVAQCGSCTVLMNGEAVRTCVIPLSAITNQKIETIESLENKVNSPKFKKHGCNTKCPSAVIVKAAWSWPPRHYSEKTKTNGCRY